VGALLYPSELPFSGQGAIQGITRPAGQDSRFLIPADGDYEVYLSVDHAALATGSYPILIFGCMRGSTTVILALVTAYASGNASEEFIVHLKLGDSAFVSVMGPALTLEIPGGVGEHSARIVIKKLS